MSCGPNGLRIGLLHKLDGSRAEICPAEMMLARAVVVAGVGFRHSHVSYPREG